MKPFQPSPAELMTALFDLPLVLWAIELDGTVTLSQGRALEGIGLKAGELVGTNFFELYRDTEEALAPVRECLAGEVRFGVVEVQGRVWENRYYPRFSGGEVVGLLGLSVDVTDRRDAIAGQRRSDRLWRSLAENNPDYILIVDREHTLRFINKVNPGTNPEDAWGTPIYMFFEPQHQDEARAAMNAAFNGTAGSFITSVRTPEGELGWWENRVSPIVDDGGVANVIITSREITQQREAVAEREHLQAQIQHAQKLESLGVLAGGIAHDFNNLLMGMMGHAELARMSLDSGSVALEDLSEITEGIERAAELCRQMLAYAGKARIEMREVDLSDLVESIAKLLGVTLPKGVDLRLDLKPGLWSVQGDSSQLHQIVMNLMTNASDAVDVKRGKILLRTGNREISAEEIAGLGLMEQLAPGPYVFVEVSDDGVGMDEGTASKMFDPFFSTKRSGRGLGMAAVLGIVRGHNGSIRVVSAPNDGTRVTVFLPRSVELKRTSVTPEALTVDGQGRLILVVDDEPTVRVVAEGLLKRLGFETLSAANGAEAVELYAKSDKNIALVLMDVTMPVMNGHEAAAAIGELDKSARIILSSGYQEHETVPPRSVVATLPKPYRASELADVVARGLATVTE